MDPGDVPLGIRAVGEEILNIEGKEIFCVSVLRDSLNPRLGRTHERHAEKKRQPQPVRSFLQECPAAELPEGEVGAEAGDEEEQMQPPMTHPTQQCPEQVRFIRIRHMPRDMRIVRLKGMEEYEETERDDPKPVKGVDATVHGFDALLVIEQISVGYGSRAMLCGIR